MIAAGIRYTNEFNTPVCNNFTTVVGEAEILVKIISVGVADGPGVLEITGVTVGVLEINGVTVGVLEIIGVAVGVGVRVGVEVRIISPVGVGIIVPTNVVVVCASCSLLPQPQVLW